MNDQSLDDSLPRYTEGDFPAYTYIPGQFPHPIRSPDGHSFDLPKKELDISDEVALRQEFLWGVDLFNHGYYWEAHEAWEGVWHAFGRSGSDADYLKGLIKLAAAGVKRLAGSRVGVARHMRRSAELLLTTDPAAIHPTLRLRTPLEALASFALECATTTDSPSGRLGIVIHC